MASVSRQTGDWDEEIRAYGQALESSRELENGSLVGWITIFIGSAHRRHGDLELAVTRYEEAHAIFVRHGDMRGLATTYRHLGWTHVRLGDMAAAVSAFLQSTELLDPVADQEEVAVLRSVVDELQAR